MKQTLMGNVFDVPRIPLRTYGPCSQCGDDRTLCCTRAHATLCCACETLQNPHSNKLVVAEQRTGSPGDRRACLK